MTIDQFRHTLKKTEKIDNIMNYLVCVVFIGFGIWMASSLIIGGLPHPELGYKKYLILIFPLTFVIIGIYGFWRIPKDYQVGSIYSLKTIDEKWAIVNEYLSHLKIRHKKIENTQIECVYRNKYLNSLVVKMYLDDSKILYNVQSLDVFNKGIIDFGLSKRATKRLRCFLESRL
ncbi:MAG: hypothetical protein AAF944_04015 [Bacteroidota bacterium]